MIRKAYSYFANIIDLFHKNKDKTGNMNDKTTRFLPEKKGCLTSLER